MTGNLNGPQIEVIVLAAGASSRMGGVDKLLELVNGTPLVRRAAQNALASNASGVIVVLPPKAPKRRAALDGLNVTFVEAPDWQDGMAASIKAGLKGLSAGSDGVIIALADMPEITAEHFNRLIAAFDPDQNREICRLIAENGKQGHPVLFGRRFFEALGGLSGDMGARSVMKQAHDFTIDVQTSGQAVLVDLDTPQDWAKWRGQNSGVTKGSVGDGEKS